MGQALINRDFRGSLDSRSARLIALAFLALAHCPSIVRYSQNVLPSDIHFATTFLRSLFLLLLVIATSTSFLARSICRLKESRFLTIQETSL